MSGTAASARSREGHVGWVCPTDAVCDDAVATFVGEGLDLGEHVVLATRDGGWEAALAQHGVDPRRSSTEEGSLSTVDARQFYPAEGQAALVDPLLGVGRPGVRLVASAEEALAHLGEAEFRRVEAEMDDVCETRPVMLLCYLRSGTAYGQRRSPALDTFLDVHPHELHCPSLTVHRTDGGLRLRGEVDVGTGGLVEAVLAHAANEGEGSSRSDGELLLDLSELTFLDVGGYRALRRGTEQWRRRGGTVTLTDARHLVRRLLETLGLGVGGDVRLR